MFAVASIIGGLALLFWWLSGHWFARTIVAILLVPVLLILFGKNAGETPFSAWAFLIALPVAGWLLSGIPKYVRNGSFTARRQPRPPLLFPRGSGGASQ